MYFNKIPPAANFRYNHNGHALLNGVSTEFAPVLERLGAGQFRLSVESPRWSQKSQAVLTPTDVDANDCPAHAVIDKGQVSFSWKEKVVLCSRAQTGFGVLGQKWVLSFDYDDAMRFYGLGQKINGFEKTGTLCKFWNTDAFADFGASRVEHEAIDPHYASIPYVLIQTGNAWVGILINDPYPVFMNLAATENIASMLDAKDQAGPSILLGAYDGTPEVYFIMGGTAREVTRKLQRMCGLHALPPLWALGYHQCRFGYRDLKDLEELDDKMESLGIPCDGLWLDIDYMDEFRVFTTCKDGFTNHADRIARLKRRGRKVIPIIDPGVKHETGNPTFDSGKEVEAFCLTPEGEIYSGFVWPGQTAFPDYSLPQTREWWANQVETFTKKYDFDGYWVDMNDPSTGSSELEDMRFNHGRDDHASYHNQYALGMQQATLDGLQQARPGQRPFLISRSGFISTSRYSALWTGDNFSNYFHLREGVAMSLNLSLSGIPFNGPDVPGFAGEASPALAVDWHKAGFLFPFFRNHSIAGSPRQEPWQFPEPYQHIIIEYLRLRYKFLPYLYNAFHQHVETGDPILRPLLYEHPQEMETIGRIGDQFYIGADIMQAPILQEGASHRDIYLPGHCWFDAAHGHWLSGGQTLSVDNHLSTTPLFFREGAFVPMQRGMPETPAKEFGRIEAHIFLNRMSTIVAELNYVFDDGETAGLDTRVTRTQIQAVVNDGVLQIMVINYDDDYLPLEIEFILYDQFESIELRHEGHCSNLRFQPQRLRLTGNELSAYITDAVALSTPQVQPKQINEQSSTLA